MFRGDPGRRMPGGVGARDRRKPSDVAPFNQIDERGLSYLYGRFMRANSIWADGNAVPQEPVVQPPCSRIRESRANG